MCRHALARAPVDDDRLVGAKPPGGASDVNRRVSAAIDDDASPEQWLVIAGHLVQHRDRIGDALRITGGNVGTLADLRANAEEAGVEALVAHRRLEHHQRPEHRTVVPHPSLVLIDQHFQISRTK